MADQVNYFENQRQGIKNRIKNVGLQQNDVMARKFASMGGGPSGAEVKDQQIRDQNNLSQQEDAIAGVNAQESNTLANRDFQSGESEKQRAFSGSEAQKARDLSSSQFGANLAYQKEMKLKELDMMQKQFDLDSQNTQFNKEMSNWTKDHTGGLLGAGGFLGTGIGAGGKLF